MGRFRRKFTCCNVPLWLTGQGAMPLVRERIADILVRKRSFVHVDEYLTRHPDFANALSARPGTSPCPAQLHQLMVSRPPSRCPQAVTIVFGIKASSPHSG